MPGGGEYWAYGAGAALAAALDKTQPRGEAVTDALDIRRNADGQLIRHIPADQPLDLSGLSNATISPCTCQQEQP